MNLVDHPAPGLAPILPWDHWETSHDVCGKGGTGQRVRNVKEGPGGGCKGHSVVGSIRPCVNYRLHGPWLLWAGLFSSKFIRGSPNPQYLRMCLYLESAFKEEMKAK